MNTNRQRIAVELYMSGPEAKAHYRALLAQREAIEQEMGASLDWRELPEKEASRILVIREKQDIEQRDQWPEQQAWLADMLEKMHKVFRPRVMALSSPEEEGE